MAKEKKAKGGEDTRKVVPADEKAAMTAKLKAAKAERDAALAEHDKKKLKAARKAAKKISLKMKRVKAIPPAKKEAPKTEEGAA